MTNTRSRDEIGLINRFFKDYRLNASISERSSHVAGKSYIVLTVILGAGARISAIEARLGELAEMLSAYRGAPTPVRMRRMPLALELPHPAPEPPIPPAVAPVQPHAMLCGQTYDFGGSMADEIVDLSLTPHTLLAGTTGSGKSVLLTTMLWSLVSTTSPADLRLVLIDLKNEDLVPFADLPHTESFAASLRDAADAIESLHRLKEHRVRTRQRGQRIVLVIDELAELARMNDTMRLLASILAIGRSKSINVIAATQKPLGAIVGSVAKANFTTRLIGRVMSVDDARVAAGVSGIGAEYLPGKGAFLRVEGMDTRRFQSYWIQDIDVRLAAVVDKWTVQLPIHPAWIVAYHSQREEHLSAETERGTL